MAGNGNSEADLVAKLYYVATIDLASKILCPSAQPAQHSEVSALHEIPALLGSLPFHTCFLSRHLGNPFQKTENGIKLDISNFSGCNSVEALSA
jgi:hypothetical protein